MDNKRKIGEEELKRALLMMKYDSKKTLTENVQEVEGVQRIDEVAPLLLFGFPLVNWLVGAAATGVAASWIDSVTGGGDSFAKTKIFFQGCSTLLSKMKPTNSSSEIKSAAATIWDNSAAQSWYQGFGSGNEESIRGALDSMKTVADLCALHAEFYKTYSRDLYDVLDSEIDGDDFITFVWTPISSKVDEAESQLQQAQEAQQQQQDSTTVTNDGTITPAPSVGKYKECSGTYTQGCFSDKIREIQTCLGLVSDGKYGPKTQAALDVAGFGGGFKDSDVDKICQTQTMPEPDLDLPTADDDIDSLN
jgi:hypothetical protein